jgi:hypothetical protein
MQNLLKLTESSIDIRLSNGSLFYNWQRVFITTHSNAYTAKVASDKG